FPSRIRSRDNLGSLATAQVEKPLAVGFYEGQGYVVHTTFHNHSQATALEKAVLGYLISKL
ncbi:MAG: hypothetical protein R3326_09160, partial [Gemmatimonadota bacterium]|nr:hypothetical protein [Gemmatimonadota bacterium]